MKKSHGIALVSVLGVLVVAIIATVLVVKHNDNQTVANGQESNISDSNSTGDSNSNKQIKLSQLLYAKNNRVWLHVDSSDNGNITRNTEIDYVDVINNGKITSYDVDTMEILTDNDDIDALTLKDASKLSDKQLIAKAKKMNKDIFNKQMADAKESATDPDKLEDEPGARQHYLDKLSQIKYKAPKAVTLKVKAYDNGTSKDIVKEEIENTGNYHFKSELEDVIYAGAEPTYKSSGKETTSFEQPVYPRVVDNDVYGGISQNYITRLKKGETIIFDNYKDKHVHNMGEADDVEDSEDDSDSEEY